MKKFNIYSKSFKNYLKKLEYVTKFIFFLLNLQTLPEAFKLKLVQYYKKKELFLYKKTSCIISFRNRGVLKYLKVSRLIFKHYVSKGFLVGFKALN